ncbi:hypothetical protein [Streptomyces jumonjinensis]|uniref:Uncharacterized protein n=1 Tax=Streptomyces jumonjinensis TaxID=1945 RepID=A0A646KFG6_STRJU|nr:hypothetical protein [Streptomyces jumonjinensis]MQT01029.1 hypothetical protein [Streptomyces jumonjinensis]
MTESSSYEPVSRRAARESDLTLAQLRGDCVRMAPHWRVPPVTPDMPVPPSRIHGVVVPAVSVRLVDAMPRYGG